MWYMTILDRLPAPSPTRIAVRVTPDAVRRLRGGHPWLFEGSIRSVNRDGIAGDLAVVFDEDRQFVAIGLWDPHSPIRMKVLHSGRPATIDAQFFRARLDAARQRRAALEQSTAPIATTGYRVVHGENDSLPGLVVDRYGHVAVIKIYSTAWIPHLATLVPLLVELLPVRSVVLRLARSMADLDLHGLEEGMSLHGPDVDRPVEFLELGLAFEADVIHGQKTGHFLDQRDNRALVGTLSKGARVLDVFCCTGGFSVHAAAGGARSVLGIDSSPYAIEAARRNIQRNSARAEVAACRYDATVGEAFAELERLGESRGRFDVVVVDPPSFARAAVNVPRAIAAYERLAALAVALVERDGVLVQASCSARVDEAGFVRAVHAGAARAGFDLDEIRRTGHALDHPIGFPEGSYLKALFATPRRRPR
jgi:23S rRNA (cytosine1962-C5)-methyltransferase